VHRVPVGVAGHRRGAYRPRRPGTTELRPEIHQQEFLADWIDQKFHNSHQLYRHELHVHKCSRRVVHAAVQDHWNDSGGSSGISSASVYNAAQQRDHRFLRHNVHDEIERGRFAANWSAGEHIYLQGVRQRQDRGRDPRTIGHWSVQHRKFVRAKFSGIGVI